ncbi:ets DNA-binding protein pokkuri [Parasteatoda tepidariorum]|uniref:ets DNA-binding protein pokkuri n=1 Tax=Parasteatoda tepidariorum TaxID=114398 RepID=UPI00077F8795|nr:ets DNA-binding protein pokkuri [Parasteatoda tepidariorum]XP_042900805.1 ets DNA-binding protein pokkuri [Parasteatoda tepidariorum]XP_042900806.1 ets DNA-binding protein pokkuri [Parasteatoda tepidariorum]XP_042900807.1 ets DNA-binding protein pokkuri [Parasteatoda tepidariorum]XP_042900808.1 ets DNA-binding protein pokkuri [Parasteatoda tepidariorum]
MVGVSMDCLEPAYLNLPGWRCVPVYAVPLSPTSPPAENSQPLDAHNLLPPNIPQDPRHWSRQHVFTWLEWCVDSFSLPPLDIEQFFMNGRGLCLLKKTDFSERTPRCGDVLYNALQVLLLQHQQQGKGENNVSASLLQHASSRERSPFPTRTGSWPRSISSDFHSMGHVIHESEHAQVAISHMNGSDVDSTTAMSPPPANEDSEKSPERGCVTDAVLLNSKHPSVVTPVQSHPTTLFNDRNNGNCGEKINVRLLWDFLQQLLNDSQQRYNCCIIWKDKSRGIFKITDPHRLAALWGKQKNHLNMNFDKMSRALRYYYRVRILQKEPGERHCYRFLRHPNELRHCKQRALLTRENGTPNGVQASGDVEAALDMSIKEEGFSPNAAD